MLDYSVYLVVRLVLCVVQSLRIETCDLLADLLSKLIYRVFALRHDDIETNLRVALPHLTAAQRDDIGLAMWKHMFLFLIEVGHAPRKIHQTNWRHYIRLHRKDLLVRSLLEDRPSLLVCAHFGNFELAGFVLGLLGFHTITVARDLDNEHLGQFLNRFRSSTGQTIVPKKGSYEMIERALAAGGMLTLLADQYAGSRGCWVEFFGRPASTHKAIALFSLHHEARMVVGYSRRLGKPLHFELGLSAEIDPCEKRPETAGVKPLTQWYTHEFEHVIRLAPEQYWWLHRRWKDRRPKKPQPAAAPASQGTPPAQAA